MMNKTIKYAALLIVAMLVIYGLFAFVLLQLNPTLWAKDDRQLFVLAFVCVAVVLYFANLEND